MDQADKIEEETAKWLESTKSYKERKEKFVTDSGIPVKRLYTPADVKDVDYLRDMGFPGAPPFTRGVYPTMYRGQPWTMRLFSGHGTAEETNQRWKMLYKEGETGLSAAVDSLTFAGVDPDDSRYGMGAEVGTDGVPLYSIKSLEALVDGLPVDKVSVALVVEPLTSTAISSMYFNAAKRRGLSLDKVAGTTQNDILTQTIGYAQWGTVRPKDLLRLACDLIEYCTAMKQVPKWHPINFTTYNYREGGIDAVQEIAFGLGNAIAHIDELLRRGWKIDDFVSRLAFHLSAHKDFFEEIAKYRAARRIWYRLMKDRYHAQNPHSYEFRYHIQTAGSSLTAQQPLVNIIRTTYQALEAVLGGCQSLHTNSYDEAISLPSEDAALLAVRTQEVLQEESGITNTIDPLAGSYYVESLTNELEGRILEYMGKIEAEGGVVGALDSGWLHREMGQAFLKRREAIESGEERVIGVNCYTMEEEKLSVKPFRINPEAAEIEIQKLQKLRAERDNGKVQKLLDELRKVTDEGKNVMPVVMELTSEGATVGEITGVYREVLGTWTVPIAVAA